MRSRCANDQIGWIDFIELYFVVVGVSSIRANSDSRRMDTKRSVRSWLAGSTGWWAIGDTYKVNHMSITCVGDAVITVKKLLPIDWSRMAYWLWVGCAAKKWTNIWMVCFKVEIFSCRKFTSCFCSYAVIHTFHDEIESRRNTKEILYASVWRKRFQRINHRYGPMQVEESNNSIN